MAQPLESVDRLLIICMMNILDTAVQRVNHIWPCLGCLSRSNGTAQTGVGRFVANEDRTVVSLRWEPLIATMKEKVHRRYCRC